MRATLMPRLVLCLPVSLCALLVAVVRSIWGVPLLAHPTLLRLGAQELLVTMGTIHQAAVPVEPGDDVAVAFEGGAALGRVVRPVGERPAAASASPAAAYLEFSASRTTLLLRG